MVTGQLNKGGQTIMKYIKEFIKIIINLLLIFFISAIESIFGLIPEYVLTIAIIASTPVVIIMLYILVIYSE